MIRAYVLLAVLRLCIFLTVSARAVLDGCEHCRGHIYIVHLLGLASEEPLGQEFSSLDGDWCQLELAVEDVADCIDVRDVRLFGVRGLELPVGFCLNTSGFKVQVLGQSVATDGKEDGVEGVLD